MRTTRERMLSGMRPTGKVHLGNYLGALANWVTLLEHMAPALAPIRERRQQLVEKPEVIVETLHEGSRRARRVAAATMDEVHRVVPLTP